MPRIIRGITLPAYRQAVPPAFIGLRHQLDISVADKGLLAFGRFRLDPQRRTLLHDGKTVKLTPKAFDTLYYLVANAGRLVEKDELLSAVWGGRIVEEGNLSQTVFSVRKALQREAGADRWIVTAPGRGYRFTADVTRDTGAALPPAAAMNASTPASFSQTVAPEQARLPRRPIVPAAVAAVLAVAVAIGGTQAWRAIRRPQPLPTPQTDASAPPPYSVAVLAFANMSGDPAQDYISDGLADELINTLTRIPSLHVAARTSAFSFKGGHATIADIARKLNVEAVLEGSVSREANLIHVNVQLVSATTGFPYWSRSYDRGLGNLHALQADIAGAVAAPLRIKLLGDELPRLVSGGTQNPQALDFYLHGMKDLRTEDPAAALKAFDAAIAADPSYALARVRRSQALRDTVNTQDVGDAARVSRLENEAIAEAERAVAQAPDLGAAHAALGVALEEGRFDFQRAALELSRARDLAPGDATINGYYADLSSHLGHLPEAAAAAAFGTTLDPLSPRKFIHLANILSFARRYPEALQATSRAVALRGHVSSYDAYTIGEIQFLQGKAAAALATCSAGRSWPLMHCQALAFGKLGRQTEARMALESLRSALGDAGAMQYATIFAQWGQAAEATKWLETAYRLHDPGLIEMQVLPLLDPIRDTAAFKDILHRMNFPP